MSIPATLSELHGKLEKIPSALLPPCQKANQEVKNNRLLSPCATGSETSSNHSQRAPVTDTVPPDSPCNATSEAKSQLLHAINIRATKLCPVDAVPDWSSVSHLPEII